MESSTCFVASEKEVMSKPSDDLLAVRDRFKLVVQIMGFSLFMTGVEASSRALLRASVAGERDLERVVQLMLSWFGV